MPMMNYEHHSELRADGFRTRKQLHDLFRTSTRSNVVVGRLQAHHHVADASSHQIRLILPVSKFLNDLDGRVRLHVAYDTFSPEVLCRSGEWTFTGWMICSQKRKSSSATPFAGS